MESFIFLRSAFSLGYVSSSGVSSLFHSNRLSILLLYIISLLLFFFPVVSFSFSPLFSSSSLSLYVFFYFFHFFCPCLLPVLSSFLLWLGCFFFGVCSHLGFARSALLLSSLFSFLSFFLPFCFSCCERVIWAGGWFPSTLLHSHLCFLLLICLLASSGVESRSRPRLQAGPPKLRAPALCPCWDIRVWHYWSSYFKCDLGWRVICLHLYVCQECLYVYSCLSRAADRGSHRAPPWSALTPDSFSLLLVYLCTCVK